VKLPTWSGDWAIPKRIVLPGCRVRVRVVPPGERAALNGCDGVTLYSPDDDKQTCAILIDGTLPLPVQRYVLLHELGHVHNEHLDIMLEHYPQFVQTKWMAAQEKT
jgi:hypothetical protein